ncbi:MAG: glycerate kinase family protein [Eubacteriaceae bacterium]
MKILVAPDSFKGTLTSNEIIEITRKKAIKIFPESEVMGVPIADGGEGTIAAVLQSTSGVKKQIAVKNPLFTTIVASYGIINNEQVLIEMAEASGLTLIPFKEGNPLITTSYGTGELIKDALDAGYKKITIAIGGSATNDGGCGAMAALGIQFINKNGEAFVPVGGTLLEIEEIDLSGLHHGILGAEIVVMCDVNNSFTGKNGASFVYGKQKGGTEEQIEFLDKGMKHLGKKIKQATGVDVDRLSGAGAAGGLGGALYAFLKGKLQSGIETVLDLVDFNELLKGVDLIITGEGRVDGQSACGKVLDGIGKFGMAHCIPIIAIAGGMGEEAEKVYQCGIDGIMVTSNGPMSLETALMNAEELFSDAVERMFRIIKVGMTLR